MGFEEIHKKIIRHAIKKVCKEEKERITKEDAKKIFDYLEQKYPSRIASEIAEDVLEYDLIKKQFKTRYKDVLRRPSKNALATLVLLHTGKTEIKNEEIDSVIEQLGIEKNSTSCTLLPLLEQLGAIESISKGSKKKRILIKNPEIVEALVEWYQEKGILPKNINIKLPATRNTTKEPDNKVEKQREQKAEKRENTHGQQKQKGYAKETHGPARTPREALAIYYARISGKDPESVSDTEIVEFIRQNNIDQIIKETKTLLKIGKTAEQKELLMEMGIKQLLSRYPVRRKALEKAVRTEKQQPKRREKRKSEVVKIVEEAMKRTGITEVNTIEDLEKVFAEIERIGEELRKSGKRSVYNRIKTHILSPHGRQIATLAAILENDKVTSETIKKKQRELRLKGFPFISLKPYETLGIIKYVAGRRNGVIQIINKKEKILKHIVERYINMERTRAALRYIKIIPSYFSTEGFHISDYLLRAKAAADLAFGKDQKDAILHVLVNPYNVRTHRSEGQMKKDDVYYTVRGYVRKFIIEELANNKQFLLSLKKNAIIKRIPEHVRKLLWIGRVAKIEPVDTKTQKVIWVSEDTAKAWAEFFEKHRSALLEPQKRRKRGR